MPGRLAVAEAGRGLAERLRLVERPTTVSTAQRVGTSKR